ncbi:MAG: ABC transporter permease subunit [archaeon]|nr:ABC transporter permease subunit [archaeon]
MNILSILKIELKKNFGSIMKVSILYALLMLMMLVIFDPEIFEDMDYETLINEMGMGGMFGSAITLDTIEGFLTLEFLTMIWVWVGFLIVLKASQDIPTAIDNKSIDIILSKPIKRWEYSLGKHIRFIITIAIYLSFMLLPIVLFSGVLENLAGETFIWKNYFYAFFWSFLLCVSLECTAFLFSTFLSRKKASSAAFTALIIFFIIGSFYSYFEGDAQDIKYFSLFYYFDPGVILINDLYYGILPNSDPEVFINVWRDFLVLIIYSAVITVIAVITFNKRDIPV